MKECTCNKIPYKYCDYCTTRDFKPSLYKSLIFFDRTLDKED